MRPLSSEALRQVLSGTGQITICVVIHLAKTAVWVSRNIFPSRRFAPLGCCSRGQLPPSALPSLRHWIIVRMYWMSGSGSS